MFLKNVLSNYLFKMIAIFLINKIFLKNRNPLLLTKKEKQINLLTVSGKKEENIRLYWNDGCFTEYRATTAGVWSERSRKSSHLQRRGEITQDVRVSHDWWRERDGVDIEKRQNSPTTEGGN